MTYFAPTYQPLLLAFERFLAQQPENLAELHQQAQTWRQTTGGTASLLLVDTGEYEICYYEHPLAQTENHSSDRAPARQEVSLPLQDTPNTDDWIADLQAGFLCCLEDHLRMVWHRTYLQRRNTIGRAVSIDGLADDLQPKAVRVYAALARGERKNQIISAVWGVKPGGSAQWAAAVEEYQRIVSAAPSRNATSSEEEREDT